MAGMYAGIESQSPSLTVSGSRSASSLVDRYAPPVTRLHSSWLPALSPLSLSLGSRLSSAGVLHLLISCRGYCGSGLEAAGGFSLSLAPGFNTGLQAVRFDGSGPIFFSFFSVGCGNVLLQAGARLVRIVAGYNLQRKLPMVDVWYWKWL